MESDYSGLPSAFLRNTSNVCYVNAVAHGVFWSGHCGPTASQAYGQASGCLPLLRSSKPQLLYRTLPWHNLLLEWTQVTSQHDAAELFAYLMARAMPAPWDAEWQSRQRRGDAAHVLHRGTTFQPVLIPLPGDSLQSCWDSWERQSATHAMWRTGLLMQLGRYREAGREIHKDTRALNLLQGQTVAVPFFDHEDGSLQSSMHSFRVLFVCTDMHVSAIDTVDLSTKNGCLQRTAPHRLWQGSIDHLVPASRPWSLSHRLGTHVHGRETIWKIVQQNGHGNVPGASSSQPSTAVLGFNDRIPVLESRSSQPWMKLELPLKLMLCRSHIQATRRGNTRKLGEAARARSGTPGGEGVVKIYHLFLASLYGNWSRCIMLLWPQSCSEHACGLHNATRCTTMTAQMDILE